MGGNKMSQDIPQPSIEYMVHLVSLIPDLTNRKAFLEYLRTTDGHPMCNHLLKQLDKNLTSYSNNDELKAVLNDFLSGLSQVFQRCYWFKKEKDNFQRIYNKSSNRISNILV